MDFDYSSPAPIAAAFMHQYKKYRIATAAGDGSGQCMAIGAMNMHRHRLGEVFGYSEEMIQRLVAQAQTEIDQQKEKADVKRQPDAF